jgi:hypothetical protein
MEADKPTLDRWAAQYRDFAELECPQDPLYVAICRAVAAAPELLALMAQAPATQRRPNLLLAALHERVLAGTDHALAAYYASVGGERAPDAELPALLRDFVRRHEAVIVDHLRSRSTQTNESGRCAVLWPALQALAARTGAQDLALLDLGCSAGLNLGVDLYRYDYGDGFQRGAPAGPQRPTIRCDWRGPRPPAAPPWRLVSRLGLDPAPVDLADPDALRWLQACLWPGDRERAARLAQAAALLRLRPDVALRRAADCLAEVEPWLDGLPAGVQPVLFNSWVLAYFEPAALARYQATMARLTATRGLAWLSAEAPTACPPALAAAPPLPAGASAGSATLWTLQWRGGIEALAWSHPHGRWLEWLAPD